MVHCEIFRAPVVWEEHEHGQKHERARQAQGPEPATQSKGATLLVCAFEACFTAARHMNNSEWFLALGFDLVKSAMEGGGCIDAPQAYNALFTSVMGLQARSGKLGGEGCWKWVLEEFAAFHDVSPACKSLVHIQWAVRAAYHQAIQSCLSRALLLAWIRCACSQTPKKPAMKDASTQTNVANQSSQASQADFPVSEFSERPTLARKGNGMEAEADIVKEEFGVADSMGTSTRGRYVVHGVAAQKENLSTQAFQSMTCSSDKDIQHAPAGVEGLNAEERDAISTSPSSMSEEDTDSDSSGESPLERVLYVLKRRLAGDRECGDDIVQKVEARLAAHWADIQKDTESGLQLDGDVPSDKDLDHVEESGALPIASSSNSAGDSHSAVDQDLDIEQAGGSDAGGKRIDSFHEEPATVRSDEAYVSSLIAQWMENFDVGACADKDLDGMDFSEGPVSPERFLEVEAAETVDQRDYNRAIFEMMNEALLETHAMHKRVRQMTGELHPSKGQLLDEVVRRVMRWISYEGTMDDLLDDDSIWDD